MLVKSQVKYIQSLSQKKVREEEGLFVAEGSKIINELLNAPNTALHQLFMTENWRNAHEQLLRKYTEPHLVTVTPSELERLSFLKTPQEVLGVFHKPQFEDMLPFNGRWTLLLDTLQDPGNMGTIIRCADWFGVEQIICSEDSADWLSPKVVQATMGSISRVRVFYKDLAAVLLQSSLVPVYAATLNGEPLGKITPTKEGILIIGNESKGIEEALLPASVKRLTIERRGGAESLNAAVATGILLSHLT